MKIYCFVIIFLFTAAVRQILAQNEGPVFSFNLDSPNSNVRAFLSEEQTDWLTPQDAVSRKRGDSAIIDNILKKQAAESAKLGPAHSCDDLYSQGIRRDGEKHILLEGVPTKVYCEFNNSDDNWLVFQKRYDGSLDFFRPYHQYVDGFGEMSGEFWLGLETLHKITYVNPHRLRIELEDFNRNKVHVDYSTFAVADVDSGYIVTVRGFDGPRSVGDAFSRQHRRKFSTFDRDRDTWDGNCAVERHGGWWYSSCSLSNLNGRYVNSGKKDTQGIMWFYWGRSTRSLKSTQMKIQPVHKRSYT